MISTQSRYALITIDQGITGKTVYLVILGKESLKAGTDLNGIYTGRFKNLSKPKLISKRYALLSQPIKCFL